MEELIPVLYDAAAVIILIVALTKSANRGFASTVVNIVGHIAAFLGAMLIGKGASPLIYSLFIRGHVQNFLADNVSGAVSISQAMSEVYQAAESLPPVVANFFRVSDLEQLEASLGSTVTNILVTLEQEVIGPAITGFIHIILFLVAFTVLCFLARHIANAVGLVCRLPLVRTVDRFLGGALGVCQGGINLYLIALAARLVLYFIADPPEFFNESVIMDTFIWSRVYLFNPFGFLK